MARELWSKCDVWNKCDECGKLMSINEFDNAAKRILVYPDSEFTEETFETICSRCYQALKEEK